MDVHKVTVLGSGPAGLTAALYAARARLEPVVVEGLEPGGQLTTTTQVENFPGFREGILGPELMERMRAQAERFGARFMAGMASGVDVSGQPLKLRLEDGGTLDTRTLIVATGARARYLGLASESALIGHGVSGCATCDGAFFRGVPVAVVGGGDSAAEEALFLTRFASRVYLIHRRDRLRASRIMAERVLEHDGIEVLWNCVVEEVMDPDQGAVTGLRLRNVKTGDLSNLAVEGLFPAIGHEPNTGPLRGALPMDDRGYLLADHTRTSVAGVFAAGDVQDARYRQAVTAAGSGCMAALEAERFLGEQGW